MLLFMTMLAGLMFVVARYGHVPAIQPLHDALIKAPSEWLSKTPPRRRVVAAVAMMVLALMFMAAPEFAPALLAIDLTLYLDAVLLAAVAFEGLRIKTLATMARRSLQGLASRRTLVRRAGRAPASARRRPGRTPPANDDDPGLVWALAA